jgi:hypothetical protein
MRFIVTEMDFIFHQMNDTHNAVNAETDYFSFEKNKTTYFLLD